MPIQLTSFLVPAGGNRFPLLEDIYVKGGVKIVANAAERDAIDPRVLKDGMLVINRATGEYHVWTAANNTWAASPALKGPQGDPGPMGPQGPIGPQGIPGADGPQGLQGVPGPQGNPGAAGAPGLPGADGLPGPTGPQGPAGVMGPAGPQGAQGLPGAAGAVWRNGTGVPAGSLGIDGDYYLDISTGDVYLRAAGNYALATNILGPVGPQGPQGPQGLQGTVGATGPQGPAGSTWRDGAGVPADTLGADGDYYLDTATGNVYLRSTGVYAQVANIVGPAGATGPQGIQGPAGATGPQGIQGIQGPAGPVGMTWMGAWSGVTPYAANSGVSYGGSSYVSLVANTNVQPGTDPNTWDPIALGVSLPYTPVNKAGDTMTGNLLVQGNVLCNNKFTALPDPVAYAGSFITENNIPYFSNGTNWIQVMIQHTLIQPYDIALSMQGNMAVANAAVASFLSPRNVVLNIGLPGSLGKCKTAPTSAISFSITQNGTPVGSMNFAAAATTATFTFTSDITFAAGDLLEIVTPATIDASIADVSVVLVGKAAAPEV